MKIKADLNISFTGEKNPEFEHREQEHYRQEGYELVNRHYFTNRGKTETIMLFKKIEEMPKT